MLFVYQFAIWLYYRIIWLASFFNKKAGSFVNGRKDFYKRIQPIRTDKKRIWFHCASLGEFEQARPLIESFKKETHFIIVSFFSPSGYEIRKNYSYADLVCYLPIDSANNARKWYRHFSPELIFYIKYEFWYYYIREASRRNIPIYLVSAVFRKEQIFFKKYGGIFRKALKRFSAVFVQDEASLTLVKTIRKDAVYLSGDTRFDRVLKSKGQIKDFPLLDRFKTSSKLLMLGSSWEPEEKLAEQLLEDRKDIKLVIAPHDISEARLSSIEKLNPQSIRYSLAENADLKASKVLIIDSIGMLSGLYAKADLALVGGAFGSKGLHNILEAAVFGKPVFFGPNTEKFNEAAELVKAGGAFQISNYDEFKLAINNLLEHEEAYSQAAKAAAEFCEKRGGATEKILSLIYRS